MRRLIAMILCAALALMPFSVMADMSDYTPGEMTLEAIGDSYVGGRMITVTGSLSVEADEQLGSERAKALAALMSMCTFSMTFYDDFGIAQIHGELSLDGVKVFDADVLVYEDGSMQLMTNLTGKTVLAVPAGQFSKAFDMSDTLDTWAQDFDQYPAMDRLKATLRDAETMFLKQLLGWTSFIQIKMDDKLYVFDDTYLEATEDRDAVSQRMLGTIEAYDFDLFIIDLCLTLRDDHVQLQQAIADVLAENGVTRYQVRQFIDGLLTVEEMDPAEDWVQPSASIADDGALCRLDDISYVFKKFTKAVDTMIEYSTDNILHMDVSYDDYGDTVGFDADLAQFSSALPYEGSFTWSKRTEDTRDRQTAHGELEVFDGNRIIGDLSIGAGVPVDNRKDDYIRGTLGVLNHASGITTGIYVDGAASYVLSDDADGLTNEQIDLALTVGLDGQNRTPALSLSAAAKTVLDEDFALTGEVGLQVPGLATGTVYVQAQSVDVEELSFTGGAALDVTAMTDEQLEDLTNTVVEKVMGLAPSFLLHFNVLSNVTKLLGE